ncbi:MAG: PHP domain-containing protein [Clostridiales bacterium]|nr:PHP domain-containing protein [Clostridiales bacterium]
MDLHVHSVFSDGLLSPDMLCALAVRQRVNVLALCDHDTADGLAPMAEAVAACRARGAAPELIPGVELSAGADGRTHILGYGVSPDSQPLREAMALIRRNRVERGQAMLDALKRLGVDVPTESLPERDNPGMPLGRPHIGRALVSLGKARTLEEAFDRYIGDGRPAYVPLWHTTAAQAVSLLREAGAVPVLAHPSRMGLAPQMLEALIAELQQAGLMGVEVFHPSASRRDIKALESLARRQGLLVTGGSDFHGDQGSRARLGGLPPGWRDPPADLQALREAMRAVRAGVMNGAALGTGSRAAAATGDQPES